MGQKLTTRAVVLDSGATVSFDGTVLTVGGETVQISEADKADLAWLITGRRDGRTTGGAAQRKTRPAVDGPGGTAAE